MAELSPRERLEMLRDEQGELSQEQSPRQRLNELRSMDGDTNGEGQGNLASNNPVFEAARKSGFLKGYLDQAAGINQILSRFTDRTDEKMRQLEGIDIPEYNVDEFIQREEDIYQANREAMGAEGFDWGRMAGNIANPVSIATMKIPAGGSFLTKTASGATVGAAAGLAQPVSDEGDYWATKSLQGTTGAALGSLVQPVISSIKGTTNFARNLAAPLTKSGRMREISEMYNALAGESKNKIIAALDNAKTHLPGSKPTSAQAIAEAQRNQSFGGSIAKMEKSLSSQPATGDVLKTTLAEQAGRRSGAIKGLIDSSDEAMDAAIKQRADITRPFYEATEKSNKLVRINDVLKLVRTTLSKHPYEKDVTIPLKEVLGDLKHGNILETNPQNLYSLSKRIKKMIETKNVGGSNEYNVKVLSEIKNSLDKQIGKSVPEFAKAQELFKQYSRPINQMQVAREFGTALESSLKKERPTPFVNAMDNAVKTLKKSTGFPRFKKLEDVMEPRQISILNKVKAELIRESKKKEISAGTRGGIEPLQRTIEPGLPNLLSRPVMFTNFLLKLVGRDITPEYEKLAIKVQQNPEYLAKLLRSSAENKERKMMIELLKRYTEMIPAQTLGREMNIPAEYNDQEN